MTGYFYEKDYDREEELKRFYRQQKSTKKECGYGSKNCSTCDKKDCRIRPYVEHK